MASLVMMLITGTVMLVHVTLVVASHCQVMVSSQSHTDVNEPGCVVWHVERGVRPSISLMA